MLILDIMIPFVNLTGQRNAYRKELEEAEKSVLDSGCYIGGPEVRALEEELGSFCSEPPCDGNPCGERRGQIEKPYET